MKIYELGTENKVLAVYPIDDYYKNPKYNIMQKGSKKKYFDTDFAYEIKDIGNNKYYDEKVYKFPNISAVNQTIYIDETAKEKLSFLFDEKFEFFKSRDDIKVYYFVNVIDGLNESWDFNTTEVKWLKQSPPTVLRFLNSPQFYYDKIKDKHIFKINEQYSKLFVSDEFKRIYEENNFTGIRFKLIWDSDGLPNDFEINPIHPDSKMKNKGLEVPKDKDQE